MSGGKKKLKPFSIAGGLPACPECGATGDYALLADRVRAIQSAWMAAGGWPDTADERMAIERSIFDAMGAINMERAR